MGKGWKEIIALVIVLLALEFLPEAAAAIAAVAEAGAAAL